MTDAFLLDAVRRDVPTLQSLAFIEVVRCTHGSIAASPSYHNSAFYPICTAWSVGKRLRRLAEVINESALPEYMRPRLNDWCRGIWAFHCRECLRKWVVRRQTFTVRLLPVYE
jgi:hypothetical protein